jgi:hypothetical protein
LAGLTGAATQNPAVFDAGFVIAMRITAGLATLGGLIAWLTISDTLALTREHTKYPHCAMDAPPLRRPATGDG